MNGGDELNLKVFVHIYNAGYLAGHNDTVESCFTDIYPQDMETHQSDVVLELLEELRRG